MENCIHFHTNKSLRWVRWEYGASLWQGTGGAVTAGGVQCGGEQRQRYRVTERQQLVYGKRGPEQRNRVSEPELRCCCGPEPELSRGWSTGPERAGAATGRRAAETHGDRVLILYQSQCWRGGEIWYIPSFIGMNSCVSVLVLLTVQAWQESYEHSLVLIARSTSYFTFLNKLSVSWRVFITGALLR